MDFNKMFLEFLAIKIRSVVMELLNILCKLFSVLLSPQMMFPTVQLQLR